jgi:hypothetical protein
MHWGHGQIAGYQTVIRSNRCASSFFPWRRHSRARLVAARNSSDFSARCLASSIAVRNRASAVAPAGDVVKLSCYAYPTATLRHAAFDHVPDAEFFGDLLYVDGLSFEDEGRIACDHEEPAQLGQRRDDVLHASANPPVEVAFDPLIISGAFSLSWLRLATASSGRFGAASPTQLCETFPTFAGPSIASS